MKEPRARKPSWVPRPIWSKFDEEVRHHLWKLFGYMYINRGAFLPGVKMTEDEWRRCCEYASLVSADILRRGKEVQYWREDGRPKPKT